jgi:hypothetical protein
MCLKLRDSVLPKHIKLLYIICMHATDINLQNLCVENLLSWLKSNDVDTLPLPTKLKDKLKDFH